MTAIAIIITSICIIVATAYAISAAHDAYTLALSKTEEPELTNEEQAEVSVDREWWHAN